MRDSIREAQRLGQSIWYDNMRRGMIPSGELQRLVDMGITGLTSNPTIFEKAIAGSADYDDALAALAAGGSSARESYEALTIEDIRSAADILRPVYELTDGADGYASLEVSPTLAQDTEGTVDEAKRLYATLDRPNVLVKVPATPEGMPAIRTLISQGININITLIFSLDAYGRVMEAYISGLEDLVRGGGDVTKAASVASFFVSRVDTAVDMLIEERGDDQLGTLRGKAAVANAKLAYRAFKVKFGDERFESLRAKGARVQRPLWASTGTKNPEYSDVLYVESLIGPDTVNTMPQATLTAFLEHGTAEPTLERGVDDATEALEVLEASGVSMDEVTSKLLTDGVNSFTDSFNSLLDNIAEKSSAIREAERAGAASDLGVHGNAVDEAVTELADRGVISRIWSLDHTVWHTEPREISDRLGWLTAAEDMIASVDDIREFAEEVREAGYAHVVVLGMGGSSLGPEVLRRTFGSAPGYPHLAVLDSTHPAMVERAAEAGDPARTLYLVSSKSGMTTEPLMMYRYFRRRVAAAVGEADAGEHFAAVTDPGTPLAEMGRAEGFRRVFESRADIGGRYSVLSDFGLVPAALSGMDVELLLRRAARMQRRCAANEDNPGAWLGAVIGALARNGRDKLTLVVSPAISGFGLWAEQLLAESTGKDGKGVLPVAGEPLMDPAVYGEDRLFVYLRLSEGDNGATDDAINRLKESGHPVVRLDLEDRYDLGAEFFRWEFATAVAGSVLGIHPFDQPNVQQAKDETNQMLESYEAGGKLPTVEATANAAELLAEAEAGDYAAIVAYLEETPEINAALTDLRRRIAQRHRIATTLGFGPRYLHSTGQLHKGGPNNGIFLMATSPANGNAAIPGVGYSFGVLVEAQARGDLRSLQRLGRRAARVVLGPNTADGTADIEIG